MAKLIKKDKCKFEAGSIIKKNKQVGIPTAVWLQLMKLDTVLQQYMYLKSQPAYCEGPSLDGFERKSIKNGELPYIKAPETPVMDKRVAEAMEFMNEIDSIDNANTVNMLIDEYAELITWCDADKFIEGSCYKVIDTPELGDPLCLKGSDVVRLFQIIVASPIDLGA